MRLNPCALATCVDSSQMRSTHFSRIGLRRRYPLLQWKNAVSGLMLELMIAFLQSSFCMVLLACVVIPAWLKVWSSVCRRGEAVLVSSPRMVGPVPVWVITPGLVNIAP